MSRSAESLNRPIPTAVMQISFLLGSGRWKRRVGPLDTSAGQDSPRWEDEAMDRCTPAGKRVTDRYLHNLASLCGSSGPTKPSEKPTALGVLDRVSIAVFDLRRPRSVHCRLPDALGAMVEAPSKLPLRPAVRAVHDVLLKRDLALL